MVEQPQSRMPSALAVESPMVEHSSDNDVTIEEVSESVEEAGVEESDLTVAVKLDTSVDVQERNELKDESLELSPLLTGGNRAEMVKQTKKDKSLEAWRKLADKNAKGYKWKNGLLCD